MPQLFHIYRSSAGSGKTRTLAKEYLKLALRFRSDYFKHVLAVTFTNKSTQEMKDRIMHYLDTYVHGKTDELAKELQDELQLDPQTFQNRAREVQAAILHQYQQFSISTIDAFFQKVIRSFTREAGILGDYRLEVEQDEVMEEVISNLIDDLGTHPQLTRWVVELALQNLENDRSWDMRSSLLGFSKEIFREEFKTVEHEIELATRNTDYFSDTLGILRKKKFEFVHFVKSQAQQVVDKIQTLGLTADDFKYQGGGVYGFFIKLSQLNAVRDFDDKAKGARPDSDYQIASNWPAKNNSRSKEILKVAEEQGIVRLREILNYRNKTFKIALSAEVVLNNFYAFGLLTDISRKLKEYKKENNVMLLADSSQFLNGIIQDSDTPFIYEKTGSFYRNYLIDEFQDTSGLQWKNFQPLLANSLDSGYPCLVVGDVKQAIYRWRGGNQELLQKNIVTDMRTDRTKVNLLNKNFRSTRTIVSFNNELFKSAQAMTSMELGSPMAEYDDVEQVSTKTSEGFVRVEFIEGEAEVKWKEIALEQSVLQIEKLQSIGVKAGDIALLARTNDEGEEIISFLLRHKNSLKAKANCTYDVISSDSLRIDHASGINLLTAALAYLLNPDDAIARAQMAYEYSRFPQPGKALSEVFVFSNTLLFENNFPEAFTKKKISLKKLPLFELTEALIGIFNLGTQPGELDYLLAFQNLVLDFANRERNDLQSFLEWWHENKAKKYITAPAGANAMQLFTLHKAKGLQFKYVVIPFCSWGLDHEGFKAPNLWVRSNQSIFKDLGYLPIRYSSALKESVFTEEYQAEHSRVFIDNLNLLYVAFTRAELGLIAFAPGPSERNFKNSISRIIHEGITHSDELKKNWSKQSLSWQAGEIVIPIENENTHGITMSLENYETGSWRDKLVVKRTASINPSEDSDQRKKINYGIHLHAALAHVSVASDISSAVDRLESGGVINSDERAVLEQNFKSLLEIPQVADWFSTKWEIRTEVNAQLPGGIEFRIDRLLLKDKQAVVIDFKTGIATKSDQKQVAEYCSMLNQMGYSAEGYLLYLREKEVVHAVPPKISKKKNQNQLGLDF